AARRTARIVATIVFDVTDEPEKCRIEREWAEPPSLSCNRLVTRMPPLLWPPRRGFLARLMPESGGGQFFDLLEQRAERTREAATLLAAMVCEGVDPEKQAELVKMAEHAGDEGTHAVIERLHQSFITPIEGRRLHRGVAARRLRARGNVDGADGPLRPSRQPGDDRSHLPALAAPLRGGVQPRTRNERRAGDDGH